MTRKMSDPLSVTELLTVELWKTGVGAELSKEPYACSSRHVLLSRLHLLTAYLLFTEQERSTASSMQSSPGTDP